MDSNFVRVRVDGEFPKLGDDVFIPMELTQLLYDGMEKSGGSRSYPYRR